MIAAALTVVTTTATTTTTQSAQAQDLIQSLTPDNTFMVMSEDLSDAYIREYLGEEQNSTAATLIKEYQTMDNETQAWLKEYILSTIRENLNSMVVVIDEFGYMEVSTEIPADYIRDDIKITIDEDYIPFKVTEGYQFQLGKIIAPNGTQILPR